MDFEQLNITQNKQKGDVIRLKEEARKGHFKLGMNQERSMGTSNQVAYDPAFINSLNDRDLNFDQTNKGPSPKLGKAINSNEPTNYKDKYTKKVNFNLGTDPTTRYETTNNINYND